MKKEAMGSKVQVFHRAPNKKDPENHSLPPHSAFPCSAVSILPISSGGDGQAVGRGQAAGTGPEGAGEVVSLTGPTSEQVYPGLHCFRRLCGLDVSEGLIQQDVTSRRV